VLADNALLSTPFVNLALVPECRIQPVDARFAIGYARAFEMFALGEPVDASSARGVGSRQQGGGRSTGLMPRAKAFAVRLARQPGRLAVSHDQTVDGGNPEVLMAADTGRERTVRGAVEDDGGARSLHHRIRRAPATGFLKARGQLDRIRRPPGYLFCRQSS